MEFIFEIGGNKIVGRVEGGRKNPVSRVVILRILRASSGD